MLELSSREDAEPFLAHDQKWSAGRLNRVVLGGWSTQEGLDCKKASWFQLELTPLEAPWPFTPDGRSEWASTSAELLVSLVALLVLPLPSVSSSRGSLRLKLAGGTDKANSSVAEKTLTTKMPLIMVLMEFCHQAKKAGLRVSLDWRPREDDQPADDIANSNFSSFSMDRRIQVHWEALGFELVSDLAEAARTTGLSTPTRMPNHVSTKFQKSEWK